MTVTVWVVLHSKQNFKGSSDPSQFIFEINVGKRRIRHWTTLNFNGGIFNWFWVNLKIQFQSRSMLNPTVSDIDFKNTIAWVWTTLNLNRRDNDFNWEQNRDDRWSNFCCNHFNDLIMSQHLFLSAKMSSKSNQANGELFSLIIFVLLKII